MVTGAFVNYSGMDGFVKGKHAEAKETKRERTCR